MHPLRHLFVAIKKHKRNRKRLKSLKRNRQHYRKIMQYRRNRQALLEQVVLRDGLKCANCGLAFKSKQDRRLTMDHRVPISKGGEHMAIVNLQLLCVECHREKDQEKPKFRPEEWGPCEAILPPLFVWLLEKESFF